MINLAVINLKDIIKLIKVIGLIIVIMIIIKSFESFNIFKFNEWLARMDFKAEKIIRQELILTKFESNNKKSSNFKNIISSEFLILSKEEKILMEREDFDEIKETENNNNVLNEEIIKNDIKYETKIISEKNKKDIYNNSFGTVKIKNESKYDLTEEILKPDFELTNRESITIYHTHTSESYTPSEKYNYNATGNFRSTDLSFSVAKVRRRIR
jgi:hypothetical protein